MVIKEDVALANYSTMRLGGRARFLCKVKNETEVEEAVEFAKKKKLKIHVVGGGSNSIFRDEGFDGLVIVNRITGFKHEIEAGMLTAVIGAGENWDYIVKKIVKFGFGDIAALSLIPGTVGGAPVQNIGAYGQEISESIVSLRVFDTKKQTWQTILRKSCNFGYRTSRFNQKEKDRFIITSVGMRFIRKTLKGPFYKDVEHYCKLHKITPSSVKPAQLRKAVIAVRRAKLPDPKKIANTGSFFKNPMVHKKTYQNLVKDYPTLKSNVTDDGKLKLYAGQMIELAGFKDYHDKATGMATWKNQALVLVNENAKTTQDLLDFKKKVIASVHASFGITLEQEPELIS